MVLSFPSPKDRINALSGLALTLAAMAAQSQYVSDGVREDFYPFLSEIYPKPVSLRAFKTKS